MALGLKTTLPLCSTRELFTDQGCQLRNSPHRGDGDEKGNLASKDREKIPNGSF